MKVNARIYKPTKTATQSGRPESNKWRLECELPTARVPEPLMGWVAAEDTLNQILLEFETADDAAAHAEKMGWSYTVISEQKRRLKPRNYGDNFVYRPADDS